MTSWVAWASARGPAWAALGVGLLGLGLEAGPLDGGVPLVLGLQGGRFLLALGGFLVGLGGGDAGLAGHGGGVGGGQVVDVAGVVLDLLDLQGVDDDAELLHLGVAAVLDLLGHPVPFPDDLLDGQAADDRAEVAGEDAPDQLLHAASARRGSGGPRWRSTPRRRPP